ncbi:DNA replication and repair protein RecF [Philodulcilactobacillus myokoensis]|uniref:DNA replication and repair protein RecF n=1 Tax=Philodulcilactobacillus myokoensis TaxID=2929573 RepID=A0A9W6ES84_9LACO|nr:DNA replication/repair protein RecF [Philodulcilactobacillus myokoensis]GLB46103.1 DNA replication and repair protein RecF [Philodulcilactobacillus myokoensis]
MKLKNLELRHFRNYEKINVNFSDGINVLIGNNAQGKTNLLEAIYVLALARSHRTRNNRDLINWKYENAQMKGRVSKAYADTDLELDLDRSGKRAKVNHIEQAKLSSYVGQLNVILFSPEDLSIVKGSPSVRRKFMDMEFGQISGQYLYNLSHYQRILEQRNRYLKQLYYRKAHDRLFLDVLSDQLSAFGAEIIHQRIQLLAGLEKSARQIHWDISLHKEKLKFRYVTALKDKDLTSTNHIYECLRALYKKNRNREIKQRTTILGPHRDDIHFIVNGKNVQTFGSQGQQRTTTLSVKLAEIDLMKSETNEAPILLLDDVLSELDGNRQTHLLKAIQDKVQTFLTTTSLSGITKKLIDNPKVFKISNGKITID